MQPGETITVTVLRTDTAGAVVTGQLVGDFSATVNGAALALTNFSEVGSGYYQFSFTLPTTPQFVTIQLFTDNTDFLNLDLFSGEIETQDLDSFYAVASSSGGISVGEVRTTGNLPDQVDGDSFDEVVPIPEAALAKVGIASLGDADSIVAGYKLPFPDAQSGDAQAGAFTVDIVSDVAGSRSVRLTAAAGFVSLASGVDRQEYRVDVTLNEGALKHTAAATSFNLIWQAGTA